MPSTKYSPVSPGTPPLVETDEESLVRPPPSTRVRFFLELGCEGERGDNVSGHPLDNHIF